MIPPAPRHTSPEQSAKADRERRVWRARFAGGAGAKRCASAGRTRWARGAGGGAEGGVLLAGAAGGRGRTRAVCGGRRRGLGRGRGGGRRRATLRLARAAGRFPDGRTRRRTRARLGRRTRRLGRRQARAGAGRRGGRGTRENGAVRGARRVVNGRGERRGAATCGGSQSGLCRVYPHIQLRRRGAAFFFFGIARRKTRAGRGVFGARAGGGSGFLPMCA